MNQISPVRPATRKRLADRETPLIRNCWYVAAWSDEVGRRPLARTMLDRPVVLYRGAEDQAVVALHDRCAHRSMPLSKGWLDGDTLVCAYHGLCFDRTGACTFVPSEPGGTPPRGVRVQAFPVVERAPYVWIWLGDPDRADPALVPDTPWMSDRSNWENVHGYSHVRCNYLRLHENLLDLTHFTYLHANNVGTPAYASAPFTVTEHGDQVQIVRTLLNSAVPPVYGWPMRIEGKQVDRHSDSWFVSPGYNLTHARIVDVSPAPGGREQFRVEVLHAITPETATTCHYFWAQARDFALGDGGVDRFTRDQLLQAFQEDTDALEWIERNYDHDGTPSFFEMSTAADKPGLQMRRVIQRLADAETGVAVGAPA